MRFGPEVGFDPKPTPDEKFLDFDPKNGVILGSEGSKNFGFLKPFLAVKKVRDHSEKNFANKKVSK